MHPWNAVEKIRNQPWNISASPGDKDHTICCKEGCPSSLYSTSPVHWVGGWVRLPQMYVCRRNMVMECVSLTTATTLRCAFIWHILQGNDHISHLGKSKIIDSKLPWKGIWDSSQEDILKFFVFDGPSYQNGKSLAWGNFLRHQHPDSVHRLVYRPEN